MTYVGPAHLPNRTELRALKVGDIIELRGWELPIVAISELRHITCGRFARDVMIAEPGIIVAGPIYDGHGSNFRLVEVR